MTRRRDFILRAGAAVSSLALAEETQSLIAGIVPALPRGAGTMPEETFWRICDECVRLGVRHIEVNNTHRRVVETFDARIGEFRNEMSKRNLTLVGCASYGHLHLAEMQRELMEQHLRVARFLKAVGGRYMNPLIAPGTILANGTDEEYKKVDVRVVARNMNAIGKRVLEETGLPMGLHPEQGDIRAGLVDPLMDAADPRYFNLWPDVGHFAACGVDPDGVYRRYRPRMVGTHLRDWDPAARRMVPFGTGSIKLPELVAFLRQTKFTGCVMGEGGGNEGMRDYMRDRLKLVL
jgi:sugar phosphate isomerase/epimerase